MSLRRLKIHGGLYLLYVLFFTVGILLIPFLYDRPGIVQLALAVTSAVGLVYFGDSRVLIGWIHRRNLRVSILLFTGIILSLVSIPHHGSFYFSDDAIRHIHDGHAFLNGVDVYGVPPAERAAVLNRLPNHPELGTIYFPFTQLQALAGAFLDRCCLQSSARVNGTAHDWLQTQVRGYQLSGFFMVYAFVVLAGLLLIVRYASPRLLARAIFLLLSPIMLIVLCSHHADGQALILIVAIFSMAGFRPRRIGMQGQLKVDSKNAHYLSGSNENRNADAVPVGLQFKLFVRRVRSARPTLIVSLGVCIGLLVGLKPEAIGWFGLLVFMLIILFFRHGKEFGLRKWILIVLLTVGLVVIAQLYPVWTYLQRFPDAWHAFLGTGRFFADWFVAYNPGVHALSHWFSLSTANRIWRTGVLISGLFCIILTGYKYFVNRQATRNHGNKAIPNTGPDGLWVQIALILLGTMILSRGVWHPWYFLNFIPLGLLFCKKGTAVLLSCLLLFYVPVAELRAEGHWTMHDFYFSMVGFFLLWIFLTGEGMLASVMRWLPVNPFDRKK